MARTSQASLRLPLADNSAGKGLMIMTLALLALGVVMVQSALASAKAPGAWYTRAEFRHTVFAVLAVLAMVTLWRVDYHILTRGRYFPVIPAVILGISLACGVLVFVPGVGYSVGGDARWIRIGPAQYSIGFQPSELTKFAMVIYLAAWLARDQTNIRSFWKTFVPAMCLTGLAAVIIITQDFGTGMIVGVAAVVTLLLAGVPWHYFLTLLPPAAAACYFLVYKSEHRWIRITAWLDPWSLTNRSAYQPRQSLLAIMTGGWFGKGVGNGIQKLGFLPEDSTDFLFSAYCEEFGFVGAALLMALTILWIWQAWRATTAAGDRLGKLLVGSLGFLIASQAVLHFAVDSSLFPPTGASLPFMSAGGTALVLAAGAVAMMVSVTAHRPADVLADGE